MQDLSHSWLGTYHKNLVSLVINDSNNNRIGLGLTRTDHKNVSGYGPVAVLSIIMPENLGGKREVRHYINFNIETYKAISASETNVPLNPTGDSILVYQYKNSGIQNNSLQPSEIKLFPDPARDILNIVPHHGLITGVYITNLLGESIYSSKNNNEAQMQLSTDQLANGIYFINISTTEGICRTRFVKE